MWSEGRHDPPGTANEGMAMQEGQKELLLSALQQHEREISDLSLPLEKLGGSGGFARAVPGDSPLRFARHVAFVTAQVMRHRISMALLESRLQARGVER